MIPRRQAEVRGWVEARLEKIKLSDVITSLDVIGPTLVLAPVADNMPPQPTIGWTVNVGLKHNMLLGQEDIVVSAPLAGVLPQKAVFEKVGEFLLEAARSERSKMNNARPQIPEGLKGKKL